MIPIDVFTGRDVAVFGLGMSGIAAAKALSAGGAHVFAWDDAPEKRWKADEENVQCGDLSTSDWSRFAALVLSPGVPLTHPSPHWIVMKAQEAGVEIIGDTELFFRQREAEGSKAKTIVVTGTNGKSTTTALTAHLLRESGRNVQEGGNIGRAVLDLEPFADDAIYVLEMSSFQIDLTPSLHPNAAALLNITPDHLDRHGSLEHYAAIKARVFAKMGEGDTAVIGVDDPECRKIADGLAGPYEVKRISVEHEVEEGVFAEGAELFEIGNGKRGDEVSIDGISALRGTHNWQNAAAAYALVRSQGLTLQEVELGFRTFPGLSHRMQLVGKLGRILFVNDSKATNADAAGKALAAFDNIYWIAGGRAKEGGLKGLEPFFQKINKVYLIGEAAEDFDKALGDDLEHTISGTLEEAVKQATEDAVAAANPHESVVLLSPACASYDQFDNFEKRGEAFIDAVLAIDDVIPADGNGDAPE
ncbi:UDP-N-acetylmuramoyl-L-alanine--D-glutamate ligase [Methyloligella solikamskensis]|uniref:UDP-N-acetylmuramoylalanine--D-glutamate ligase n=1 Tax=Methyloligella solikamskensis TaxID=1177756 RepID=A0ABW3JBA7_9HYPH